MRKKSGANVDDDEDDVEPGELLDYENESKSSESYQKAAVKCKLTPDPSPQIKNLLADVAANQSQIEPDFIQKLCAYTPEFVAYQKIHAKEGAFRPGFRQRVAHIVIAYCLKDDVTRELTSRMLQEMDAKLCKFFSVKKSKSYI